MSKPDFDKLLLEAADEIGVSPEESSKQAICSNLEKRFNNKKQEIQHMTEVFADSIEIQRLRAILPKIFIVQQLLEKVVGYSKRSKSRDPAFNNHVAARQFFLWKRKAEKQKGFI